MEDRWRGRKPTERLITEVFASLAVALLPVACGDVSETQGSSQLTGNQTHESDLKLRPAHHDESGSANQSGDIAAGQVHHATYCDPCHGARGDGDGPLAAMLDTQPARHSDPAFMNVFSDAYLFQLLKDGGPSVGKSPLMAAWGETLSNQQIWDLVAYLRTLAD